MIVLRLSFLPPQPLHVPRQGRGSPKGLSFSSSAADVCLQSGAKCHEAPAESLSRQQRSLICAGRPFLPGVGCDPEACVQVFEASDRSLWLSQLSAAARGVWFPDRGSHSAPDAGSTDWSPLGHQRSPVASARKTERKKTACGSHPEPGPSEAEGRVRPWGMELPGGTTFQGIGH